MTRITSFVVFLLAIFTTFTARSQREPHGYVSIGLGPSFKLNGEKVNSGLQLNLLEVGYEFWKGIGVAASWGGGAYAYKSEYYLYDGTNWHIFPVDVQVGYGFLMLGPMYSIHVSNRASLDLKWRVGRSAYDDRAEGANIVSTNRNTSLGYMISGSFQYRLSDWWSVLASLDYGTNRANFNFNSYGSLSTLAVSAGIGLRIF